MTGKWRVKLLKTSALREVTEVVHIVADTGDEAMKLAERQNKGWKALSAALTVNTFTL